MTKTVATGEVSPIMTASSFATNILPEMPRSMPPSASQTAVLLIAHGSRRPSANEDLVQLAGLVAEQGGYEIVEVSYLELAEPTITTAGRSCVERGARRVLMLPYFLSAGVHVVTDLEDHRRELGKQFPGVEFILCPHLGLHPLMVDIVLSRLSEWQEPPENDPALVQDRGEV